MKGQNGPSVFQGVMEKSEYVLGGAEWSRHVPRVDGKVCMGTNEGTERSIFVMKGTEKVHTSSESQQKGLRCYVLRNTNHGQCLH